MKIRELITEAEGTMHDHHATVQKGVHRARDVGGYDRIYHLNRMGMALALADGQSTDKIDGVDQASWNEKFNTMHPYTEHENNMIQAAFKTIPTDHKEIVKWSKSEEPDDTHKISPTPNWMKKNKVKESASVGATSSANIATAPTGAAGNGFLNGGPGAAPKKKKAKIIKR